MTTTTDAAVEKVAAGVTGPRVAEPTAPPIRWFHRLLRNRSVVVGAVVFLIFLLAAIFAEPAVDPQPARASPRRSG